MRFFKPLPSFWEWIIPLSFRKIVVDIGCGNGDLLREMHEQQIKAFGIDIRYELFDTLPPRDLMSSILPFSVERAVQYEIITLGEDQLIRIVCRPSHGGFIRDIPRPYYYIGLERNLDQDFEYEDSVKFLLPNVGEDGENLYRIG